MRALITGMGGFIGSHLADFLLEKNFEVYGTFYKEKSNAPKDSHVIKCDISKKDEIEKVVKKSDPDCVFHMAAQSFVVPSWKNPWATMQTNVIGTLNLLDVLKGKDCAVAVACSSAEYGTTYKNEVPIKEERELRPSSPYAVSKVSTDMLSYIYHNAYGMRVFRLRYFNIIGPRKTGSAIAEWAQSIAEIEAGKKKELGVGNLDSVVDFTDIRDAVKATWLITQKGSPGDVYNICSGEGHKMEDVLKKLTQLSKQKIKIVEDPKKFRPLDDPIFIGDNTKLKNLGWAPSVPFEKTMEDTLNYWRNEIK